MRSQNHRNGSNGTKDQVLLACKVVISDFMTVCQHIKRSTSLKFRGLRVGRDITCDAEDCDEGAKKGLGHKHGRRLQKDIEAIFTLIEKKNFLGYEILDIGKRGVKLKKHIIFITKLLNRYESFLNL